MSAKSSPMYLFFIILRVIASHELLPLFPLNFTRQRSIAFADIACFYIQQCSFVTSCDFPINLPLDMHPSLLDALGLFIPAVVLNPVLVLHVLNYILTGALPTLTGYDTHSTYVQAHVDMHEDDFVCWVYTIVLVVAQLSVARWMERLARERRRQNDKKYSRAKDQVWVRLRRQRAERRNSGT